MHRFFTLPQLRLDIQTGYVLFILGAFALSLFLTYLLYRSTNPPVSRGLRRLLFGLRLFALFVLLFLLLEPVVTLLIVRHERPVIAVLADDSASMSITDRAGSRRAILDSLLRSETIGNLSSHYDLVFYKFAGRAVQFHPDREESVTAQGRVTNIGGALRAVQDSLQELNLQAFVLLTDGGNNLGQEPGRVARSLKHPVFTVGIGDSTELRDAAIVKLVTNEITYTENEVSVEATIRSSGLGGMRVAVGLKDGNTILDSQYLLLSTTGGEQVVTLHYTPLTEGLHKYTVSLPVQEGEIITQNNRRDFVVRVLKSKIKVLIAAGSPGPELSFMKRALEKDKDIEVTAAVAKRGGGSYGPAFPKDWDDLKDFDAIVLLALPRHSLGRSAEMVSDFVAKEGKGLLMIPGRSSATWTKYGDSPIADILPVQIAPAREQFLSTPFIPLLSAEGLSHPVTRLDEDPAVNQRKWADVPPLLGAVRNCLPKAQAMILAVHPQFKMGEVELPFIALQRSQKGKAMVINGLPLWRWDFMMWGIGKSGEEYVRFITNAVRWLTTREESELVAITTAKRMYHSGEPIDFSAQVYDEQYRALDGAEVVITVVPKDTSGLPMGSREFELSLLQKGEGWGRYEGSLRTVPPGDYRFVGKAMYRGRLLGRASGELAVEEYSMEFENPRMNAELLRRLSEISGGVYLTPKAFNRMTGELRAERRVSPERRPFVLWDHPLLLGAFLLSVLVEWTIRKRKGMV